MKTIAIAASAALAASATSATAASLITGKQIKDGSITLRDLSPRTRHELRPQIRAKSSAVTTTTAADGTPIIVVSSEKGDPGAVGPVGPQGIQGERGPQGIQGIQGEPAVRLWLHYDPANLKASPRRGVTSVVQDKGAHVTFDRDISACAPLVTLDGPANVDGTMSTAAAHIEGADTVVVDTIGMGQRTDKGFTLAVMC